MKSLIRLIIIPAGISALLSAAVYLIAHLIGKPIGVEFWKGELAMFLLVAVVCLIHFCYRGD